MVYIKQFFYFGIILLLLTGCSSKRAIAHGLDEKEANEIIVVLEPRGISAEKTQEAAAGGGAGEAVTWRIDVPEDQSTRAMSILNQLGLPRRRGQNLLRIFENSGLVPSELQEKIKYEEGLSESIASSIRKMDGVLDADVRLSFPKEDPLNPQAKQSEKITASVYVKHAGALDDPNSLMIPRIKRLVAGSVTGLNYDNVTVIPDRARYAEESLRDLENSAQEEKDYVSIWTIVVAKESATRFRVVFFSAILSILIILLSFIWIVWKVYPILRQQGGLRSLFHLHPIEAGKTVEVQKAEAATKAEEVKPPQEAAEPEEVEEEEK